MGYCCDLIINALIIDRSAQRGTTFLTIPKGASESPETVFNGISKIHILKEYSLSFIVYTLFYSTIF
jgi:hypothetical protein